MTIMKLVLCILFLLPAQVFAGDKAAEADPFWKSFRRAVVENKIVDVASLTHFPFEVRGAVDSDPVHRVGRSQFPGIFRRLCGQRVEVRSPSGFVEKTMVEIIKEKQALAPNDFLTADAMRVHQFFSAAWAGNGFLYAGTWKSR